MSRRVYWFRQDLRLHDNPLLRQAANGASCLLFVYCHDERYEWSTPWDFPRRGPHSRRFLRDTLDDLRRSLATLGSGLLECQGKPVEALEQLVKHYEIDEVYVETLAAPEEQDDVQQLQQAGIAIRSAWQSTLIHPDDAPFGIDRLPRMYTYFRKAIAAAEAKVRVPLPAPDSLPPPPEPKLDSWHPPHSAIAAGTPGVLSGGSSFPYGEPAYRGGETAALRHVQQYFERRLAQRYDATRNELQGIDYSSKFSPWLANGSLSVRTVYQGLQQAIAVHGGTAGTESLWQELLWRDFFRYLHLRFGRRLYGPSGLTRRPHPPHDPKAFRAWCEGRTGHDLIDAGMRELAQTGFLSNRLRQVVASYLIHELACDWRAGAAWFESCLVDFDVFNNQGNWLAAAGRGTDARGRRFNPDKQARDFDRLGHYRSRWTQTKPADIRK